MNKNNFIDYIYQTSNCLDDCIQDLPRLLEKKSTKEIDEHLRSLSEKYNKVVFSFRLQAGMDNILADFRGFMLELVDKLTKVRNDDKEHLQKQIDDLRLIIAKLEDKK